MTIYQPTVSSGKYGLVDPIKESRMRPDRVLAEKPVFENSYMDLRDDLLEKPIILVYYTFVSFCLSFSILSFLSIVFNCN